MFHKILIANRGEIACRIARTCRRLGVRAATVHSEIDRNSLHVREIGESVEVGGPAATDSYLNIAAIVHAAKVVGAEAVHPGIGFLSENPDFADAVEAAGLIFIGPRPETMRRFSDKWDAKCEAILANVPVIAGSDGATVDPNDVERQIRDMKLPVLLKAAAGGGGRGVRVVSALEGLRENIDSAMREAQSAFGRPDLLIEQFIDRPRHIEIQVAGDGQGGVIHLFERECSLQRRFQKVVEEAPAFGLDPALRDIILEAAVRMAGQVQYRGVGTMEFLVAGKDYFFLECNPRLQVEHTITEEITGIDLVELQLRIAAEGRLPISQDEIKVSGHAMQARLYAENTNKGFMPSTGRIIGLSFPQNGVRVDTGVDNRSDVTPYYDSMIAKLVAVGDERIEALAQLMLAVEQTSVLGVETNLTFLSRLLSHSAVIAGGVDNRFIDRELATFQSRSAPPSKVVALAAKVWLDALHPPIVGDPWSGHSAWRLGGKKNRSTSGAAFVLVMSGERYVISLGFSNNAEEACLFINEEKIRICLFQGQDDIVHASFSGCSLSAHISVSEDKVLLSGSFGIFTFEVEPFLRDDVWESELSGRLAAPMMGKIIKVNVAVGDRVKANEALVLQESMKMELSINAPFDGSVVSLDCACGDLVERNAVVVTIEPA